MAEENKTEQSVEMISLGSSLMQEMQDPLPFKL